MIVLATTLLGGGFIAKLVSFFGFVSEGRHAPDQNDRAEEESNDVAFVQFDRRYFKPWFVRDYTPGTRRRDSQPALVDDNEIVDEEAAEGATQMRVMEEASA